MTAPEGTSPATGRPSRIRGDVARRSLRRTRKRKRMSLFLRGNLHAKYRRRATRRRKLVRTRRALQKLREPRVHQAWQQMWDDAKRKLSVPWFSLPCTQHDEATTTSLLSESPRAVRVPRTSPPSTPQGRPSQEPDTPKPSRQSLVGSEGKSRPYSTGTSPPVLRELKFRTLNVGKGGLNKDSLHDLVRKSHSAGVHALALQELHWFVEKGDNDYSQLEIDDPVDSNRTWLLIYTGLPPPRSMGR